MAGPERTQFGQNPVLGPPPPSMYNKPVGPCFQCGMIGHLKRQCPKLVRPQYPFQSGDIDKLSHTVCIDNEVGDTPNNVCVKSGLEGPIVVYKGSTVGLESLAVQGKRCESDLKETLELSSKNESTTTTKGVNNFSRVIGSAGEAQELGDYRVSKLTVAEPAGSLDHAMENQDGQA